MRLKAGIFVAALTRRVFADGGMAAVERHGADDAGAIFIRIRHRDGTESLAAPAPQTAFGDDHPDGRLFELRKSRVPEAEISEAAGPRKRGSIFPDILVGPRSDRDAGDVLDLGRGGRGLSI